METNEMKNRAVKRSFIQPAANALEPVESEDLSRFEGEGGLEAPVPAKELIDVPLENASWPVDFSSG